ncbi:hypothetical protein PybrP1_003799 [[Pythium] brassicae (nom. inval.)]|nr:hypothetical protein PybrP1_003799 [[Pythium] brassicae (nom. inval.)]
MYDFCLTIPYGMLLGIGGIIGYVNSGSATSALAGGASGLFLTFVGYCSYNEYTQSPVTSKLWPALSLGVSGALTGVMGVRYQKTGAFFPAGFIAATSAAMSLFYIAKLVASPKPHYKKKK